LRAIVRDEYGPPSVLRLEEVEKPAPKDDEVLIQVHAASVNAADWHILRPDPFFVRFMGFGVFRPRIRILGGDVAGVVEAVGGNVTHFRPGDEVYGELLNTMGAYAEYVCGPEGTLTLKPVNLSFEQAAAVPMAALTALQGLRDHGQIKPGQTVLINGASGGVGTYAVQIAKYFGTDVTAVCSTRNVETATSLGADRVIDYTKEDFVQRGDKYDLVLAANGNRSIFDYKRALSPGGTYVATGGSMKQMFQAMILGPILGKVSGHKMGQVMERATRIDLLFLKELIEAGKVEPFIERRHELQDVPEAVRYVEEGHARGKVVIKVR
jgi:NADPH:quinone reductase-like Zn-dependent oxidoreductase